ncbi:hypothetical protein MSAN_01308200 [Mycena sanguinolenta]|uniref:Uncharacterized protein n=1 Tax=Mycena sanguinolenta TaxID=230812 RepID=A0A8H6YDG2_9AGAR|nr:hypothetical protein MSAN_01308200 [Mycena sanguinolenta]
MSELEGATHATLEGWLKTERDYLSSPKKEPEEETLQMEYYQALGNFYNAKEAADGLRGNVTGLQFLGESGTNRAEAESATHRYLEARLELVEHWQTGDENWAQAQVLVSKRCYQLVLDKLESLVAARLLELWKMNIPGTGYKLHKHIAKAMQVCSKAVRTALANYNAATAALESPRPPLEWEAVVEDAFLAEFDLLRFSHRDIRRVREEIERLNVEIHRLYTYMRDEDAFLAHHARCLRDNHQPQLAHQVELYCQQHTRFSDDHHRRLEKLCKEAGCTAILEAGTAVSKKNATHLYQRGRRTGDGRRSTCRGPTATETEVEGAEDVDAEAVADSLELVLHIAGGRGRDM